MYRYHVHTKTWWENNVTCGHASAFSGCRIVLQRLFNLLKIKLQWHPHPRLQVVCVKPKGWYTIWFILDILMQKCYTYLQLEPFTNKKKRCYVCVREGTFVWSGQKEESRLRIDGCEQRSDLRWTLADGWMKEDTQLHRSLTLLSSSLRLRFPCALTHATCIHQHMLTRTRIHAQSNLSVALTFPEGICGQSRVSLEPVDLFKFSDGDISAILYSYSPNAKIISPLSAGSSWQVYQGRDGGLRVKSQESLCHGSLAQRWLEQMTSNSRLFRF